MTTERAEEPEWSPKGRAKLSLPFQSFCHSVTRLLVLQLIYLSSSLSLSFFFTLSFLGYQSAWSKLLKSIIYWLLMSEVILQGVQPAVQLQAKTYLFYILKICFVMIVSSQIFNKKLTNTFASEGFTQNTLINDKLRGGLNYTLLA